MTTSPVQASDGPLHQPSEGIVPSFDHPALDVLDAYRQEAGLSHQELWLRYLERGGISTETDMEAILCGALVTSDHDHDVIALALNERFTDLGRDDPVPYATA